MSLAWNLAAEYGVTVRLRRGKRHNRLVLERGDRRATLPLSATPSDRRGMHNFRSQLRRTLETLDGPHQP